MHCILVAVYHYYNIMIIPLLCTLEILSYSHYHCIIGIQFTIAALCQK